MAKKSSKKNNHQAYRIIGGLVAISLLVISVFKFGIFGIYIDKLFRYMFGEYHIVIFVVAIILSAIATFQPKKFKLETSKIIGAILLFVSFLLISSSINSYDISGFGSLAYFIENSKQIFNYEINASGGFLGQLLYSLFTMLFDVYGTYIFTGIITLSSIILIFGTNIFSQFKLELPKRKVREKKPKRDKKRKKVEITENNVEKVPYDIADIDPTKKSKSSIFISVDEKTSQKPDVIGTNNKTEVSDKTGQLQLNIGDEKKNPYVVGGKDYQLPKLTLLDTAIASRTSNKNITAAKTKGAHLIDVLKEFNIESELVDIHIGPSVTKFEIRPDSSVKVSRINSISDNIKMELAARSIRIEAPIPGKNTVGIEIPNIENTPVKLYELLKDVPASEAPLLFTLGKDLMGNIIYCDLAKMPHLLVAGATGAGKSVALNAIITTIILRTTPEEVRFLLIDPKKVEFNSFASSPHLMTDIISEPTEANAALMRIVELMDERYRDFAKINVKNIKAYNEYRMVNPEAELPKLELLVVIIDELADLMVVAGKEVEQSIQRITQLARAAGIHLIVATQRPSADVITGIIKANIPSRISFAVSSGIDSRTILDTTGAEKLLGNGDMLYYPVGYSAPVRLQGVYISDDEVVKVADFAAKQPSPDHFEQFNFTEEGDYSASSTAAPDALFEDAVRFVIDTERASTSSLQRQFGIGYNRAARMIDMMEDRGLIGPQNGSKPRDVYINDIEEIL